MNEVVRISVPVSPEAAASLASEEQLREIGQFVSALILRAPLPDQNASTNSFARVLLETRAAAAASGLTDNDVDAELSAWKRERATRRR